MSRITPKRAAEIRARLEAAKNHGGRALDEVLMYAPSDLADLLAERELLLAVVEAYERWTGDPDEMVSALRAYRAYRATTGEGDES